MLHLILAAVVLFGYAGALWWLLRRESAAVFLVLTALCGVSLALRVAYTGDYPAGYNGDELGKFIGAVQALRSNRLFTLDRSGWPVLLNVLFEAPLVHIFGPTRWAIRTYSHVTSILSTPVAFAALRGFGLGVLPSVGSAALIAVLPWSIFYGRVSSGGELIFHALLVVAALARIGWRTGGWVDMAIGAFGLSALLYDYGCGRVIFVLPLVAAVLAPTWRARLLCAAIPFVALLAWLPLLIHNPDWIVVSFMAHVRPEVTQSVQTWRAGLIAAFQVLRVPGAQDGWLTICHAALHPTVVLALAAVGFLIPSRVSVFLLAGFVVGILPVTITDNAVPSTHRMLMAFPFVALAAGRALDLVKWRLVQLVMVVGLATFVAVTSTALYFSPEFWPSPSRGVFNEEATALFEAIPVPAPMRLILMKELGADFAPRTVVDPRYELLTVQNWFPPKEGRVMYGFSAHTPELRPFYENLVGHARVSAFGRAFLVTLENGDWSWMRQHGWNYEIHCGDTTRQQQVPVLYHFGLTFSDVRCIGPVTHIWRGHWNGPEVHARLSFAGAVRVDTPAGNLVQKEEPETRADFVLPANTDVTVTLISPGAPYIGMVEVTPAGERVPVWERVTPAPDGA